MTAFPCKSYRCTPCTPTGAAKQEPDAKAVSDKRREHSPGVHQINIGFYVMILPRKVPLVQNQ